MLRLIGYLAVSVILFAGGAGLSWLKLQRDAGEGAANSDTTSPSDPLVAKVPSNLDAPLGEQETPNELPVPVRGRPMTAEEIFRYGASIRGQYESLVHRQQAVEAEEARLKLMYEDIRGTRQELDGIQARVNDAVTMAERLLSQLQAERAVLDAQQSSLQNERPDLAQSPPEMTPDNIANIKQISQWVEGMQTKSAAEYLKHLSNDGNLESATQVLGNIEARTAAKILSEMMDDPELAVQLTESYRNTKRPPKKTTQRR